MRGLIKEANFDFKVPEDIEHWVHELEKGIEEKNNLFRLDTG